MGRRVVGQAAEPFLVWGRWWCNKRESTLGIWRVFWGVVGVGDFPGGMSSLLTFGVTVLEGDGTLILGGEAPTTWKAQSPSSFRLVGATWTWLAGLEPIYRVLAR